MTRTQTGQFGQQDMPDFSETKEKKKVEIRTIQHMDNSVKRIWLKISEQLASPDHPLCMLIKEFQKAYIEDITS
jgi:hypothetical protein